LRADDSPVYVRNTEPADFEGIAALTREVYPSSTPWSPAQLASHLRVFPEGQFVAIERQSGRVAGMSASLIVRWDDYSIDDTWSDFTEGGYFTSHDPERGRTLYGAEVMVSPSMRGMRIGSLLYEARRELAVRLGLLRIRAGARLAGYHRYADQMSAEEYTLAVVRGELGDPTLTFQLRRGFHVVAVVRGYLPSDRESLGYAAVIEWLNDRVASPSDYASVPERYRGAAGGQGTDS
jgi:ribosomal protein S18 acetylase RimI-like enzyme